MNGQIKQGSGAPERFASLADDKCREPRRNHLIEQLS